MSDPLFFRRLRSMRPQHSSLVCCRIPFIALLLPAFLTLCPQAQAQVTPAQAISPAAQKAQAAQQALAARDRTFELLQRQSGSVDPPEVGALQGAHDLDGWLWSRYRAVTADSTLSKARGQRLLAGLVNQDLQLAEDALQSNDPIVRRRGLRVATIANLYAGSLSDDPRLQAALYQGFLLPNVDLAPRTGWGSAPSLLEGASVAFGLSGRSQDQRATLGALLQMQQRAGNVAGADMARVHLARSLENAGDYGDAFQQLDSVTTADLAGAKMHMRDLFREIQAQRLAQPGANQTATGQTAGNDGNAGTGANAAANANAGAAATNNGAGETNPAQPGGDLKLGVGPAMGGRRLAQGGAAQGTGGVEGGGVEGGGEGEGEGGVEGPALDGESEAMRRVRLATEAAKKAQELSKTQRELATISLAKWLDASDAQAALDASSGAANGRAPARATAPVRPNAPKPDLLTLRTNAQKTAREASEAAGDAKRAGIAAQQATAEAARLALRVFIVDQDTPKAGENTAPAKGTQPPDATQPVTATQTQPVPLAPAPQVQPQ